MWENTKPAVYEIFAQLIKVDVWTAVYSIGNFRLFCCTSQEHLPFGRTNSIYRRSVSRDDNGNISVIGRDQSVTNGIDYWSLFVERCKIESLKIQELNWLDPDDVLCFSSTATVAIPGVTIGENKTYLLSFSFTTLILQCQFLLILSKEMLMKS